MTFSDIGILSGDTQGEWNFIFRRKSTSIRGIPVALTNTATTTTSTLVFGHYTAADEAPSGGVQIRHFENGGTFNYVNYDDAANNTYALHSFASSGTAWTVYKNKASQSLQVHSGSNNGNWHGDISFNALSLGSRLTASAYYGEEDIRLVIYTNSPLTTQERSDLYDWAVAEGML
jgi:hypothetical protein